jgi:hypothetical protein
MKEARKKYVTTVEDLNGALFQQNQMFYLVNRILE